MWMGNVLYFLQLSVSQVWEKSGKLRAKAIDVDIAMFESTLLSQLNFERNMSCKVDNDCFMISCGGKCNKITRKCAGILTSSNLVVRVFFM